MGTHKKRREGAVLVAAGILVKLISLFYRIPLTNILGDEGQGYYSIACEIYALALLLTSYSMPLAISRLVSERIAKGEHKNAWKVFQMAAIFSAVAGGGFALLFYFGADFIAVHILTSPYSAYPLRYLAPGLFFVALLASVRGYFQGMGTMIPTAVSQVLEQLVNAIAALLGAAIFLQTGAALAEKEHIAAFKSACGAAGASLGPVLGALAALFFLLVIFAGLFKRTKRLRLQDTQKRQESFSMTAKVVLLACVPVLLSTVVYNISQSLDAVLFTKIMSVQGMTRKEYMALWGMFGGKYNVWIHVPLTVANAIGISMLPGLAETAAMGDRRLVQKKLRRVIRAVMLIAIPGFAGLTVLAKPLFSMLYSGNIEIPSRMMYIGAVSILFFCLSTVTSAVLQGLGRMTLPVRHAVISLVVHLVSVFIMMVMLKWNIYAVVAGNVIFSLCMCVLNQKAIRRATGYRQEVKKTFLLPVLSSLLMGTAAFVLSRLLKLLIGNTAAVCVTIIVSVLLYGICLIKLKAVSERELLALPKGVVLVRFCKQVKLL